MSSGDRSRRRAFAEDVERLLLFFSKDNRCLDITDKWITEDVFEDFDIVISNSKVPSTRLKLQEFGPFDIIIDDGDHNLWAQILTLRDAWPLLKKGGLQMS